MSMREPDSKLLYWAGVALGPLAWAINVQAVYALAPVSCGNGRLGTIIAPIFLALVALAGTAISARAMRRSAQAEWSEADGGIPRNFMAWLGAATGVLFALVIANQLAAALMISPCLR